MSPIRSCLGCRRKLPQTALLRFVLTDGDALVGRTVPGRGHYLCPTPGCLAAFERKYRKRWSDTVLSRIRSAIDGAGPA